MPTTKNSLIYYPYFIYSFSDKRLKPITLLREAISKYVSTL